MVEARRLKIPSPLTCPTRRERDVRPPPARPLRRPRTDLDQLRAWILDDAAQPIAVLGPGGIGKTKLTIAALHDPAVVARFAAPACFVRLDEVRDEAGIYGAIAGELGREPWRQPLAACTRRSPGTPTLLVLDNAESALGGRPRPRRGGVRAPRPSCRARAWSPRCAATSCPAPPTGGRSSSSRCPRTRRDPVRRHRRRSLRRRPRPPGTAHPPRRPAARDRAGGPPRPDRARRRHGAAPWETRAQPPSSAAARAAARTSTSPSRSRLSLASPRLTDAGRRLFALLGRLPHGLARADLAAIMPRDGTEAATALAQTGLILRDPDRLRMLAPVREHAAEHTPGEPEAAALTALFAALADALPYQGAGSARPRRGAARTRRAPQHRGGPARPDGRPPRARRSAGAGSASATRGGFSAASVWPSAYETARDCFAASAHADPGNAESAARPLRQLEQARRRARAQGDLPARSRPTPQPQNIADKLAAADPGNAEWQFDLGQLEQARRRALAPRATSRRAQAYSEGPNIAKLAASDPGNAAVAARPLRQLEQARRRAAGPGRPPGALPA